MVLGARVNRELDGFRLQQNGEGPDLERDACEQGDDGEEVHPLPGHGIGAPARDEAQRETEDDADGGHGAVAEGGIDHGGRAVAAASSDGNISWEGGVVTREW